MSRALKLIESPLEGTGAAHDGFACEMLSAIASAPSLEAAMRRVADRVRIEARAAGVEWWGADGDGKLTRVASSGTVRGRRESMPLGRTGAVVVHEGDLGAELRRALHEVTPMIRRRAGEEQLARAAGSLARRNEELDDFAALVAHELKAPLEAALGAPDPADAIGAALDLVDMLLEAAQSGPIGEAITEPSEPLDRAIASVGGAVRVTSDLSSAMPLAPGPLFVILRNLLSNAASAGAKQVHVSTERSYRCSRLVVEDDGAGPGAGGRYATGSRLGLSLCRRIAARSGGTLELAAGEPSGSRATLTFGLAPA